MVERSSSSPHTARVSSPGPGNADTYSSHPTGPVVSALRGYRHVVSGITCWGRDTPGNRGPPRPRASSSDRPRTNRAFVMIAVIGHVFGSPAAVLGVILVFRPV